MATATKSRFTKAHVNEVRALLLAKEGVRANILDAIKIHEGRGDDCGAEGRGGFWVEGQVPELTKEQAKTLHVFADDSGIHHTILIDGCGDGPEPVASLEVQGCSLDELSAIEDREFKDSGAGTPEEYAELLRLQSRVLTSIDVPTFAALRRKWGV
jgi:hypothetical protein